MGSKIQDLFTARWLMFRRLTNHRSYARTISVRRSGGSERFVIIIINSSIGKNSDGHLGGDRAVMKKRCRVNIKEDHWTIWTLRRKFCLERRAYQSSTLVNPNHIPDSLMLHHASTEDITKPENAYTRKSRNLLVFSNFWDKNRNRILRNRNGGI